MSIRNDVAAVTPTGVHRVSATRVMRASPAQVWGVITDPRGHVAVDGSGMLMSADGAEVIRAVGDRFDISMDREALGDMPLGRYTVTNVITRYDEPSALEWNVAGQGMEPLGHVYGYELRVEGDGTRVTSYCDWSGTAEEVRNSGFFPVIEASTLRASLGILERVAVSGSHRLGR